MLRLIKNGWIIAIVLSVICILVNNILFSFYGQDLTGEDTLTGGFLHAAIIGIFFLIYLFPISKIKKTILRRILKTISIFGLLLFSFSLVLLYAVNCIDTCISGRDFIDFIVYLFFLFYLFIALIFLFLYVSSRFTKNQVKKTFFAIITAFVIVVGIGAISAIVYNGKVEQSNIAYNHMLQKTSHTYPGVIFNPYVYTATATYANTIYPVGINLDGGGYILSSVDVDLRIDSTDIKSVTVESTTPANHNAYFRISQTGDFSVQTDPLDPAHVHFIISGKDISKLNKGTIGTLIIKLKPYIPNAYAKTHSIYESAHGTITVTALGNIVLPIQINNTILVVNLSN
jgi:hypothetical protein